MKQYTALTGSIGIALEPPLDRPGVHGMAEVIILTSEQQWKVNDDGDLTPRWNSPLESLRFHVTKDGLRDLIGGLNRLLVELTELEERTVVSPLPPDDPPRFAVGDKVVLCGPTWLPVAAGKTGTVSSIHNVRPYRFQITLDDGTWVEAIADELAAKKPCGDGCGGLCEHCGPDKAVA